MDHLENKVGRSLTAPIEEKIIAWTVRRIPRFINSRMLTFGTLPIIAGIIWVAGRVGDDSRWLWAIAALIGMQWLTDSLDGALGRYTKSGLRAWGFYVDHLSDFLFLMGVIFAFSRFTPSHLHDWLWGIAATFGGMMVSTYLVVAATSRFQITHGGFGPTEARLVVAALMVGVSVVGFGALEWVLPATFGLSLVMFLFVAVKEARTLWRLDAANGSQVAASLAPDASPARELFVILGGRPSSRSGRRSPPRSRHPEGKARSANQRAGG